MLKLVENIRQGFASLKAHRLRATITASIIAIGITALVGILTSIDAMSVAITNTMTRFGARSFNISNQLSIQRWGRPDDFKEITYNQARLFESRYKRPIPVALSVMASFNSRASSEGKTSNPNLRVLGVDEDYLLASAYELTAGRNFTPTEVNNALPVAIIGSSVMHQVFGVSTKADQIIGKRIQIDGNQYKLIGVLEQKGSSMGSSGGDRLILVSIQKARQDFKNARNNIMITVLSNSVDDLNNDIHAANILMRRIRLLRPTDRNTFTITRSDSIADDAKKQLSMVSSVGVLIAVITLLGAAVSLMNIMLVSVTERTKEIGLRKALGATASAIRNQFLVEAIVICQIGGLAGIVFGLGLGNLVGNALGGGFVAPWFWILMSLVVCVFVGLVAGLYPARKASKLDPIEALRHDG